VKCGDRAVCECDNVVKCSFPCFSTSYSEEKREREKKHPEPSEENLTTLRFGRFDVKPFARLGKSFKRPSLSHVIKKVQCLHPP